MCVYININSVDVDNICVYNIRKYKYFIHSAKIRILHMLML